MNSLLNMFVILNVITSGYSYNAKLIKDYLNSNYITTALFISCGIENEPISNAAIKHLQQYGVWTNVWDISTASGFVNDFDDRFFARHSHQPSVLIDLECNETSTFLAEVSKRVLFHHERNWLMFSSSVDGAFDVLSQQNVNFDAEMVLLVLTEPEIYDMYDVYNPSYRRRGRLNIKKMGNWKEEIGWNVPLEQMKLERRNDLQGITFPAVIPLTTIPKNKTMLEHLNSNEFVHLDSMSRLMYRLFVLMMDKFNFKVNLRLASFWGLRDANGTWHGAVGALNSTKVDFCLTGLRWDNERYGVYEQTAAAYYAQFLFIFRHPKSVDAANVFLTPFETIVWFATIALCLVSACILRYLFSVENHKKVRNYIKSEDVNEDSYSNTMLVMFGFIFQQGYAGNPLLTSSRVVTISTLLFSVLMFQFYSSFIVGSLLTEAPKNIKTIKQLLNSRLEFGIDAVPYVLDNFHHATEESTVQLYNKIMKNPEKALMPLQTGLNLLKRGGFAFNTDGSHAYHVLKHMLTDSETCDLQDISYLPKQPVGPGVTNKSPFREMVKISIRKFTETGILSYHNKVWYGVRPRCEVNDLFVAPVDIVHFSSALFILGIGILCSITICALEIATSRYLTRKSVHSKLRN